MKRLLFVFVVLLSVGSMATASHIIDDFDSGYANVFGSVSPLIINQGPTAGVIGPGGVSPGRRYIESVFVPGDITPSLAQLTVTDGGPGGVLNSSIPTASGNPVPTLTLSYGSYNPSVAVDLNADFTGDIQLRLDVLFADQGGSLTVTIDANDTTYTSSAIPVPTTPAPSNTLFIPFTDFGTLVGDGLTNVDGIEYTFTGPAAWDIQLDLISSDDVIPEPATMSLLGLGLVAVIRRRKRK